MEPPGLGSPPSAPDDLRALHGGRKPHGPVVHQGPANLSGISCTALSRESRIGCFKAAQPIMVEGVEMLRPCEFLHLFDKGAASGRPSLYR